MEKKELRDRLVQLCVKAYMFGSEQVIVDLPSLIDFVEQELDKAREEERHRIIGNNTPPYFRMGIWVDGEKFECQSVADFREIKDTHYKEAVIQKIRDDFEKMIQAIDEHFLSKLKE